MIYICFVLLTNSLVQALSLPILPAHLQTETNTTLSASFSLPNPYPLPGTPFHLTFDSFPHSNIPEHDVLACIVEGFRRLRQDLRDHANGPIPVDPAAIHVTSGDVEFKIWRTIAPDETPEMVLRYEDAIRVLGVISMWMGRYGLFSWYVHIRVGDESVGHAELGQMF